MFINMLDINIESYEHVLGPPKVFFNSEKNIFSRKIRPSFNGLIGKNQNVIKEWSEGRIRSGDARFHT